MPRLRVPGVLCTAVLLSSACLDIDATSVHEQHVGKSDHDQHALYALSDRMWSSRVIPVCWENPGDDSVQREWVRDAVIKTWHTYSKAVFVGWKPCIGDDDGIRIRIRDEGPHTRGLGTSLDGESEGMVLNFTFQNWSQVCQSSLEYCIRAIAVHEFGHALGFAHEQNRPDTPGWCQQEQGTDGDTMVGEWDLDSVMNYCNPTWNNGGSLSTADILGVQRYYGLPVTEFVRALSSWAQPEVDWQNYKLHVADVSGDGRADLIWNELTDRNRTFVALSNGDGGFTRVAGSWTQPEQYWQGYKLHVADVNADNRADLIWSLLNTKNRTYVALSNGNGTFTRVLSGWEQPEQGWTPFTLHVADVNADNRADLIWNELTAKNRTYVALSNGNGTFRRVLTAWDQPEQGWTAFKLHVADVTGDRRADLIWSELSAKNRTYVAMSNGTGAFTRVLTAWDQPEQGWDGYKLHTADVNEDGRADLIWNQLTTTRNRTFVSLSNGNGTFRRALTAWDQPSQNWSSYQLHLADVNGDSRADLIWNGLGNLNRTFVATSNGPGTFTRVVEAWVQPETGWSGYELHAADVNSDGLADLIWNETSTFNRTYLALSAF